MLKKAGMVIYWLGCIYIIFNLLVSVGWLRFFDFTSMVTVLVPTITVLFTHSDDLVSERLSRSLKVCWLSGGLAFTYGAILIFSNFDVDVQGILGGFSVALLPIVYCFVISLFYAPFVFTANTSPSDD